MRHRYVWFYNRMSTIVVLIAIIVATMPVRVSAVNSTDYVANEVLVKLKPLANVLKILNTYGLDPNIGPNDRLGSLPIYRLQIIDGVSPLVKAATLALNPLVAYAEPNYIGQAPAGVYQSGWSKGDNDD